MNRLGMSVAFVLSLMAGCLANDQTEPGTTTSSQDLAIAPAATSCIPDRINSCIFPTVWNSSITAVNQYWAGDGTATPAKVMNTFLYPTKPDPTTGLATAFYAFSMAGYETCTPTTAGGFSCVSSNSLAFFYEVSASQLANYRAAERLARNTHEQANPYLTIWDGGVGGPNLGHPIGPAGPGGLPQGVLAALKNASAVTRNAYVNVDAAFSAGQVQ